MGAQLHLLDRIVVVEDVFELVLHDELVPPLHLDHLDDLQHPPFGVRDLGSDVVHLALQRRYVGAALLVEELVLLGEQLDGLLDELRERLFSLLLLEKVPQRFYHQQRALIS